MVKNIIVLSGQAGSGKDYVADLIVKKYNFVKVAFADEIKRSAMRWYGFSEEQLWGPSEERNKPDYGLPLPSNQEESNVLAQMFKDWFNSNQEMPFKDYVKNDRVFFSNYLTVRHGIQGIGTEVGRSIYSDTWVYYTLEIANNLFHEISIFGDRYAKYNYTPTIGLYSSFKDWNSTPTSQLKRPYNGVVISDGRFINELNVAKTVGCKLVRVYRDIGTSLSGEAAAHVSEQEQKLIPDSMFDYVLQNNDSVNSSIEQMMSEVK